MALILRLVLALVPSTLAIPSVVRRQALDYEGHRSSLLGAKDSYTQYYYSKTAHADVVPKNIEAEVKAHDPEDAEAEAKAAKEKADAEFAKSKAEFENSTFVKEKVNPVNWLAKKTSDAISGDAKGYNDVPIANYFDESSPCTEAGISLLEGNNADAAELKRRLGIQILVLANPTDVSRARTQHLYDSLSPELKCITSVVPGILYKDYATVKDMILFDKPELVSLSDESRQAAWTRFTVNTIMHWGQFFSYGFFCCNVAHLAAWDRAAGFSGITVVLEDDSVLLDKSLTVNQLLERILEDQINGTGLTWLEPRPCLHSYGATAYAVTPNFAKKMSNGFDWKANTDDFMNRNYGAGTCTRSADDFIFQGWGIKNINYTNSKSYGDEQTKVSSIQSDKTQLPLGAPAGEPLIIEKKSMQSLQIQTKKKKQQKSSKKSEAKSSVRTSSQAPNLESASAP